LQAPNPRILAGELPRERRGLIGRVVIDEDDLPRNASQTQLDLAVQFHQVAELVERRYYERELRSVIGHRSTPGAMALLF
jgi:hypothetical protein